MKIRKTLKIGLCAALSALVVLCGVPAFLALAGQGLNTNLEGEWFNRGSWSDTADGKVLTQKSGDWGRTYATGTVLPKESFTAELEVSHLAGADAQLYLEFGILDQENPQGNARGMTQVRIQELEKESVNNVSVYAVDDPSLAKPWVRKSAWKPFPEGSDRTAFTLKVEVTVGDTTQVKVFIDGQLVTEGTLDSYEGGYFGITTFKADVNFTAKKLVVESASLAPSTTTTEETTTTDKSTATTTSSETSATETDKPTETQPSSKPAQPVSLLDKDWASGYGTWEQKDGALVLSASDKKNAGVFLPGVKFEKEPLTLEMSVEGFQGETADITNPLLKLVLGVQETASTDPVGKGIVDVRLQGGKVAVYEWNESTGKMAVATGSWKDAAYGKDFTLKAELDGDKLTVSVDGGTVGTWTLGRYGDEYKGGALGLATWGAADGLTIRSLTAAAASLEDEETPGGDPQDSTTTTTQKEVKPVDLLGKTWKPGYGTWEQKSGSLILTAGDKKNAGIFLSAPRVGKEPLVLEAQVTGFQGETADITNPLFKLVLGVKEAYASDPSGKGIVDIRLQDGKVAVYEWNESAGKMAAATGSWKEAAFGKDFILKAELDGDKITVSVDGKAVGTWTLGRYGDEYRGGGFGVAAWGAAGGLTVKKLEATAASLSEGGAPSTGEALPVAACVLFLGAAACVTVLARRTRKIEE
jgi:hypothetical protein